MNQPAWYWARLHILNVAKGVGYYYIDPQHGRSFQMVVPSFEDLPAPEIARRAQLAGYGAGAPGFKLGAHEEMRSSPHLPPKFLELTRAEFATGDPQRAFVLELSDDEIRAYGLPPAHRGCVALRPRSPSRVAGRGRRARRDTPGACPCTCSFSRSRSS